MVKATDITIVNYADNFWLFAKSESAMMLALEALRSEIFELPGGSFNTEVKQSTTATAGFRMLGCWIKLTSAGAEVWPTETNLEALSSQFALDLQSAEALLFASSAMQSQERFEGVQAYLRLRCRVSSWVAAYAFCSDTAMVRDDLLGQLDFLAYSFGITDTEIKAVKDPSVEVAYMPYGLSSGE